MGFVKELTKDLVSLVDMFLHSDPFTNAYAIWDLYHLQHRAKFFVCIDGGKIVGLLLDYFSYAGFHFIWLWGEEKVIERLLLEVPLPSKMVFHVFPELEGVIRENFPITAKYLTEFMILEKGNERLYIKHEIRPLSLKDANVFARLRKEYPTEEDIERAKSFIREQSFYGIFKDNELISVACVQAKIPEIWMLGGFYTKPKYRNEGCATSLASFLVKEALKETNHVGLHVRADNYPAKRVYEKVGFRVYRKMCWLDCNTGLMP